MSGVAVAGGDEDGEDDGGEDDGGEDRGGQSGVSYHQPMSVIDRPLVFVNVLAVLTVLVACGTPVSQESSATTPVPDSTAAPTPLSQVIDGYLESYFQTFPSRATAAGRHDLDHALEDLTAERRASWVTVNRDLVAALRRHLGQDDTSFEDRLDAELVLRQAQREIDALATRNRPVRDPLFWTGIIGNATVFLLVRDDRPLAERLDAALARAEQLPRLAGQAQAAIDDAATENIAPELCALAARQARASAGFYRQRFAEAAGDDDTRREAMTTVGVTAADALDALAAHFDRVGQRATGSPRLETAYAETFRIVTGIERPLVDVLAEAESALVAKKAEAATFGRTVWPKLFDVPAPADDVALLRRLFERLGHDRAEDVGAFVEQYRSLIDQAITFVRDHDVVTLPEPLTLHTDRSPSYFVGQSVGGVYAAGPYAPEADTLFYLPSPPDDASDDQKAAFFRDFNDHFNVMITPHELVPGHYLQLKMAARHPRTVRALFGDGIYIEGWGTFCERLMLDLGWGGDLPRLAHLKKQLENIARTIVDIRVHTQGMTRDEVLAFVRDEALQDAQFAGNMWTRTITSAPQLTSYFLGYQQVSALYHDVRAARGDAFVLRAFMDGMMELGPVPVAHYRQRMLGETVSGLD